MEDYDDPPCCSTCGWEGVLCEACTNQELEALREVAVAARVLHTYAWEALQHSRGAEWLTPKLSTALDNLRAALDALPKPLA